MATMCTFHFGRRFSFYHGFGRLLFTTSMRPSDSSTIRRLFSALNCGWCPESNVTCTGGLLPTILWSWWSLTLLCLKSVARLMTHGYTTYLECILLSLASGRFAKFSRFRGLQTTRGCFNSTNGILLSFLWALSHEQILSWTFFSCIWSCDAGMISSLGASQVWLSPFWTFCSRWSCWFAFWRLTLVIRSFSRTWRVHASFLSFAKQCFLLQFLTHSALTTLSTWEESLLSLVS